MPAINKKGAPIEMTQIKGNAATEGAVGGGSEDGHAWLADTSKHNRLPSLKQARRPLTPIRAKLLGDDTCTAAGITAVAAAPVLALCRQLLAAGMSPDTTMLIYRGTVLALRVRSIGEAAGREIAGDGVGFRRARQPDAAPPMRSNGAGAP